MKKVKTIYTRLMSQKELKSLVNQSNKLNDSFFKSTLQQLRFIFSEFHWLKRSLTFQSLTPSIPVIVIKT